jgi:hypothetical protein
MGEYCSINMEGYVNNGNQFRLLHLNIQYLRNKLDLLQLFVNEHLPHIIVITEHGLKLKEIDYYKLDGYNLVSSFCREHHKGGGVAIYIGSHILAKPIDFLALYCKERLLEVSGAIVQFKCCNTKQTVKHYVIGIYHPPNSDNKYFLEQFNHILDRNGTNNLTVVGDLNIDAASGDPINIRLTDILNTYNLVNIVSSNTRITSSTSSQIDYVIVDKDAQNLTKCTNVDFIYSDHLGQLVDHTYLSTPKLANIIAFRRNTNTSNINSLKAILTAESWESIYSTQGVDNKWDLFYSILLKHFNQTCPLKETQIPLKRKPPNKQKLQLTPSLIKLKQEIKDLNLFIKNTKQPNLKQKLNIAKKKFKTELSNHRKNVFNKKITSSLNVSRSAWNLINKYRSPSSTKLYSDNICIKHNNEMVLDPTLTSDILNKYFISPTGLMQQNTGVQLQENTSMHINDKFAFHIVTNQQVSQAVKDIKTKYSYGWDELSSVIVKKCVAELIDPLTYLINCSIKEGIFPNCLKLSIIRPIHKKGSKEDVSNYRPISLIPTFSKIFESLILSQMLNFFTNNNILSNYQHGFRKNRSTITAASNFLHLIHDFLDQGLRTVGIFLDLTKAFDLVNHDLLLKKLERLNIKDASLQLLSTYLINRKQCTKVNHLINNRYISFTSCLETVIQGVPQGSILGPFLFLVYVNDIKQPIYTNIVCYADDTSLLFCGKNYDELQNYASYGITEVTEYFQRQGLLVNKAKSKLLDFKTSHSQHNNTNTICDIESDSKDGCKFLGLHLDDSLTWINHINYVCGKICSGLYLLRQMSNLVSADVLKILYYGTIFPFINYGIELWGCAADVHINRILLLQKRAIRIIHGLGKLESCQKFFIDNKYFTVYSLYLYKLILFFVHHNKGHQTCSDVHQYNTRNKSNYFRQRTKLKLTEHSPFINGHIWYNKLPDQIKKCDGTQFKIQLKDFLLNKGLYSFKAYDES